MDPNIVLYQAVTDHNVRMAEVLLKGGADANALVSDIAPLHLAAGQENNALMQLMIQHNADSNLRPSDDVDTPLQVACANNVCSNVEMLLEAGGDPILLNSDGKNCLQLAQEADCDQCIALLKLHQLQNCKQQATTVHRNDMHTLDCETNVNEFVPGAYRLDVTSPDHPIVIPKLESPSQRTKRHSLLEDTLRVANRVSPHNDSESPSFHTACGSSDTSVTSPTSDVSPSEISAAAATTVDCTDWSRLSQLDVTAAGPLHSTVRDDHRLLHSSPPPVLSATALLNNLSLETLNIPFTDDDDSVMASLSHKSSKTIHGDVKQSNAEIPVRRTLRNTGVHRAVKTTLQNHGSNSRGCRSKTSVNRLVNQSPVTVRSRGATAAQFRSHDLYTDDESTMLENVQGDAYATHAHDVYTTLPDPAVYSNRKMTPGRGTNVKSDTVVQQQQLQQEVVAGHCDVTCADDSDLADVTPRRRRSHRRRRHADFFSSPITSTRLDAPDHDKSRAGALDGLKSRAGVLDGLQSRACALDGVQNDLNRPGAVTTRVNPVEADSSASGDVMSDGGASGDVISDGGASGDVMSDGGASGDVISDGGASGDVMSDGGASGDVMSDGGDTSSITPFNIPTLDSSTGISDSSSRDSTIEFLNPSKIHQVSIQKLHGDGDDSMTSSASSKHSVCTCSCEERVVNDDDVQLLEVLLSKDALDCSVHSSRSSCSFESTILYDVSDGDGTRANSRATRGATSSAALRSASESGSGTTSKKCTANNNSITSKTRAWSCSDACDSHTDTAGDVHDVVVPSSIRQMSDSRLRSELTQRGDRPGPMTPGTRQVYETRLARLRSDPQLSSARRKQEQGYCAELRLLLDGRVQLEDTDQVETSMCRVFLDPNPCKAWREGTEKKSFNYLLLDPSITRNLPARCAQLSASESFETFLKAIFYVGKGQRSRPYQHFKEAIAFVNGAKNKAGEKVLRILRVWESGLGVVSLHIFQNVLAEEAYTREACMIAALGLHRLTNVQPGQFYRNVATWPARKRRLAGALLLRKAYNIYLHEGERQLRAYDIQAKAS